MPTRGFWLKSLAPALAACFFAHAAHALPGFYASKGSEKVSAHSTQIALMKKGPDTVVTVMPDYDGPLTPFAFVFPVPKDVTVDHVLTLKREFMAHLDQITAPRFHEYWEMDPCEPGDAQQEWERSMKASSDTAFLGGGVNFGGSSGQKVAKELSLDVEAKKKEGEYTFTVLEPNDDSSGWLKAHGYTPPAGAIDATKPYLAAGQRLVVAEVDTNRVELVGANRAQLSPIRFSTAETYDSLPLKVGLTTGAPFQELVVYVLEPTQRFEVKNYKNVFPPTNIEVDYVVKERMGEFYNALYDRILKQTPDAFLNEFAWNSVGCGQPCSTEALAISELLSLGADTFEERLPEDERKPKPPDMTDDEKKKLKEELKAMKPADRKKYEKQVKEDRETIVARKALVQRHMYVISRLHYRYSKDTLKVDPTFGPASKPVEGGIGVPKGKNGDIDLSVHDAAQNRLQVRYQFRHPNKKVINCDSPERYRWAKMPREVRMLRKIWVADDLDRKSRTQIDPAKVVRFAIPSLGLAAAVGDAGAPSGDAGADAGAGAADAKKEGSCGCRLVGGERPSSSHGLGLLSALGLILGFGVRRRARI